MQLSEYLSLDFTTNNWEKKNHSFNTFQHTAEISQSIGLSSKLREVL